MAWVVLNKGNCLVMVARNKGSTDMPLAGMYIKSGRFGLGFPLDEDDEAEARRRLKKARTKLLAKRSM